MQPSNPTDNAPEAVHFLDYWRVVASRKEIVLAAFLAIAVAGTLVTLNMRKTYMASALVQVRKETPDVEVFTRDLNRTDPQFLRTQFEIIQSRPVIEETVRRLNLAEKFSRAFGYADAGAERALDQTVKMLTRAMRAQQYRDTNLIEIQVYVPELGDSPESAPAEAARIADMIAEVYRTQNMRRSHSQKVAALDALKEELEERRREVAAAEAVVNDIRQKYKITLVSSATGTDASLDKISLQLLEQRRILAGQEMVDKRSRFERLAKLTPEERLHAAQHVLRDEGLSHLVMQLRRGEVDLSQKLQAFGDRHPEVLQTRAVIAELNLKIGEALQGLMTGLRIETEALQAQYDEMTEQLETRKARERTAEAEGYREFETAVEQLEHAKQMRNMLEVRHMQESIELKIPRTTVEVLARAKAPGTDEFVRPRHALNIALGILVGLATGLGLAFFVEYLDTSVKTIDEIEQKMNTPVLGVIPQKVKPFTNEKARSSHAEAYRVLRSNIHFSKKLQGGKALCVTSGGTGEGKSLTMFNLAFVCAQLGDKVLLVDGDLHRPTQHKMVGSGNAVGLANVLVGDTEFDEAVRETGQAGLHFLPSGKLTSGIHGLLDNARLGEVVALCKERYDLILIDSPPVVGVSDTSRIVRQVDGVIQVVQHRKYPWALSNRAKFAIENVGGNLLGVVVNNLNMSRDYSYYGYGYHGYYGYGKYTEGEGRHAS